MADWYYSQGGKQLGPVSDEQLRGMIASGELRERDSVWKQGMGDWAPISSMPELRPAQAGSDARRGLDDDYRREDEGRFRPDDAYGRDAFRDVRRAAGFSSCFSPWSAILVGGAALWFINFFLPWYSVFGNTLLGFRFFVPIFAFILSFLILGSMITSWFVPVLAQWRWTGAFFFALMALVLLILGFFQFEGSFNSVGPFFHLFATLVVLAGAVLEGVFGLLAFLKTIKQRS